jgi:hypothetical protein
MPGIKPSRGACGSSPLDQLVQDIICKQVLASTIRSEYSRSKNVQRKLTSRSGRLTGQAGPKEKMSAEGTCRGKMIREINKTGPWSRQRHRLRDNRLNSRGRPNTSCNQHSLSLLISSSHRQRQCQNQSQTIAAYTRSLTLSTYEPQSSQSKPALQGIGVCQSLGMVFQASQACWTGGSRKASSGCRSCPGPPG